MLTHLSQLGTLLAMALLAVQSSAETFIHNGILFIGKLDAIFVNNCWQCANITIFGNFVLNAKNSIVVQKLDFLPKFQSVRDNTSH